MIDFSNLPTDYNMMSPKHFEYMTIILGFITGLLIAIIFYPFYAYSGKKAIARCKMLHPTEIPIWYIKSGMFSSIIITIIEGAFLGTFLLPFFIFKNVTVISPVTYSNLWLYFIVFFITIYWIFLRFNITYILTDKGIRLICPYRIIRGLFKKNLFIPYENIKSLYLSKSILTPKLLIYLKNNQTFDGLICFAHLDKAQKIIENYINKGV